MPLAAFFKPREETDDVGHVFINGFRVVVVSKVRIVFKNTRGGRRFDSDENGTVAHRFAENRNVAIREILGAVIVAERKRGESDVARTFKRDDVDVVAFENRDRRVDEARVEEAFEHVENERRSFFGDAYSRRGDFVEKNERGLAFRRLRAEFFTAFSPLFRGKNPGRPSRLGDAERQFKDTAPKSTFERLVRDRRERGRDAERHGKSRLTEIRDAQSARRDRRRA